MHLKLHSASSLLCFMPTFFFKFRPCCETRIKSPNRVRKSQKTKTKKICYQLGTGIVGMVFEDGCTFYYWLTKSIKRRKVKTFFLNLVIFLQPFCGFWRTNLYVNDQNLKPICYHIYMLSYILFWNSLACLWFQHQKTMFFSKKETNENIFPIYAAGPSINAIKYCRCFWHQEILGSHNRKFWFFMGEIREGTVKVDPLLLVGFFHSIKATSITVRKPFSLHTNHRLPREV